MRGRLNAEAQMRLPGEVLVRVSDVESGAGRIPVITLVAERCGAEIWESQLGPCAPDATSMANDINTADYRAFYWDEANLLVVAGELNACVVDADTGVLRGRLSLGMTGLSSLDFLHVRKLARLGFLLIVTPRVCWLVDETGKPRSEYRYEGPIESVSELGPGDELVIGVYDVDDPSLPVVDHVVAIGS